MKKIILVCGSIAGIIAAAMCIISIGICYRTNNYEGSMLVGYVTMLIAFSMIFVGIKNYRDKHNSSIISFGKAFTIGFYISLIASTIYVAAWAIDYYVFIPDWMDKYADHMLKQTVASGAGQAEINKKAAELAGYKEMYKNPFLFILLTYAEILPVGLVVTLICALLLKRKRNAQQFIVAQNA